MERWERAEVIALCGLIVAILTVIVPVITPEIRCFLRLCSDNPSSVYSPPQNGEGNLEISPEPNIGFRNQLPEPQKNNMPEVESKPDPKPKTKDDNRFTSVFMFLVTSWWFWGGVIFGYVSRGLTSY